MKNKEEVFEMKIVSGGKIIVYVKIPYANLDEENWRDNLKKLIELNRPKKLKSKKNSKKSRRER